MDVTTKITKAAVNTHMTKVGTAIITKLVLMLMPVVGGERVSEEKKERKENTLVNQQHYMCLSKIVLNHRRSIKHSSREIVHELVNSTRASKAMAYFYKNSLSNKCYNSIENSAVYLMTEPKYYFQ